jgi:hypothetical protein
MTIYVVLEGVCKLFCIIPNCEGYLFRNGLSFMPVNMLLSGPDLTQDHQGK